jgi:hypothetical protein
MPAYIGTGGGGGMKHPTGGTIGTPTGGGTGLSGQGWLDGAEVGGFKGTDSGSGVESLLASPAAGDFFLLPSFFD